MNRIGNGKRGKIAIAAAAIAAAAFAIWIMPVALEGKGTVAAAEKATSEPAAAIDCSIAVWPNIPTGCLKGVESADAIRVIVESRRD